MKMNPKERIRQLQDRLSRVHHYQRSEVDAPEQDQMQAGLLARLLECVVSDTYRRQIVKRDGTLADWTELTIAIQNAHILLAQIRRDGAEELTGWRLAQPRNETQEVYSFLFAMLLELGDSSVEIEDRYPDLTFYFNHVRDEQFTSRRAFQII